MRSSAVACSSAMNAFLQCAAGDEGLLAAQSGSRHRTEPGKARLQHILPSHRKETEAERPGARQVRSRPFCGTGHLWQLLLYESCSHLLRNCYRVPSSS